jgi:hypothetical protein
MSDLERFRDHCRTMAAEDAHTPECVAATNEAGRRWDYLRMFREWRLSWGERPDGPPMPCPGGCISDADRLLFSRLADEVDAYLAHDDEPLWEDA